MSRKSEVHVQDILNSVPEYIKKVKCDTNRQTKPFKCAVVSCPNTFYSYSERDKYPYKFHNFPRDKKLRKIWKRLCGWTRGAKCPLGAMVCSDHFSLDHYMRNYKEELFNPKFKRELKKDALPDQKLGINNIIISDDSELDDEMELAVNEDTHRDELVEIETLIYDNKAEYNDIVRGIEMDFESGKVEWSKSDADKELKHSIQIQKELVTLKNKLKTLEEQKKMWDKRVKYEKLNTRAQRKKELLEYKILRRIFSDRQIRLLKGSKAVWTDEDIARAFTLRHMGGKECYLYLKYKLNMPLPTLSCIQKWISMREN